MKKFMLVFVSLFLFACASSQERHMNTILSMASPKSIVLLQGKSSAQVRKIMGEPTFVRKEKPHESWVFKAPDCAVFVFFDRNGVSTFTESKGSCDKKIAKRLMAEKNQGA